MTGTGVLPTYQRFVNGVPGPSYPRRSFRSREKYFIVSVILTFGVVCFGSLFFLPEFRSSNNAVDSVYKVYRHMQKAGPELLIPAPPQISEGDTLKLLRHDSLHDDPHVLVDREKFKQRLNEDPDFKVIERPDVLIGGEVKPSASAKSAEELIHEFYKGSVVQNETKVYLRPTGKPVLAIRGSERDGLDSETMSRRRKIKQMMQFAWDNYVRYAWGKNELKPLSKRGHSASIFGNMNMGATIVDGLDTLYIMGMDKEYKMGRDWIENEFDVSAFEGEISVFETNIRVVGGLLTCYAFTGDTMFRDKAKAVADKLLPAFDTPTGIPHALVNLENGHSKNYQWASGGASILSEFGTLQLEFNYLSDVTNDPIYRQKVEKIREVLKRLTKPNGLYPNYLNPKTGRWGQHHMSMGGLGDSFYEYLLKAWIQSGYKDNESREMFDEAMSAVMTHMLKTSQNGLMYFAEMKYERIEHKMDHLGCFSGGLMGLGANRTLSSAPPNQSKVYMDVAKAITHTCHESYDRSDTKLGPEAFRFTQNIEAKAVKSNEKYYILRPEVVESYFIMWRVTKDKKYRDWGWEATQAIERHCKVAAGYSGIKNVYQKEPSYDDVQQSFFLAETLKYLYLLFSDDDLISLDQWVFNTEAHPLPIKGVNQLYRPFTSSSAMNDQLAINNNNKINKFPDFDTK